MKSFLQSLALVLLCASVPVAYATQTDKAEPKAERDRDMLVIPTKKMSRQKKGVPTVPGADQIEEQAGEPGPNARIDRTKPRPPGLNKTAEATKPVLKKDQFSLDKDGKVTVFSTKLFNNLLLSEHCFKNPKSLKPNCKAWLGAQKDVKREELKLKSPHHNNMGALFCEAIGGQSVIAKTSENNESDFCLFDDGSMVSSWSAYEYKNKK